MRAFLSIHSKVQCFVCSAGSLAGQPCLRYANVPSRCRLPLLSFQKGNGGGVGLRVAQADVDAFAPSTLKEGCSGAVKCDKWLARVFTEDLDIVPAKVLANAGPESF